MDSSSILNAIFQIFRIRLGTARKATRNDFRKLHLIKRPPKINLSWLHLWMTPELSFARVSVQRWKEDEDERIAASYANFASVCAYRRKNEEDAGRKERLCAYVCVRERQRESER